MRRPRLHAVLGVVVVTIGFWLAVGAVPVEVLGAFALGVAGFLAWQGRTLGRVWAWTSLLLGLDSLAWPIVTMIRISRVTEQPDDQQMGMILTAVVAGLFASVFWLSFGWGIFRWIKRQEIEVATPSVESEQKKRR
jgi:hypothetical protein